MTTKIFSQAFLSGWSLDLFEQKICVCVSIGIMGRVFTNGPGEWDSIPDWIIPKPQKMVLDISLITSHFWSIPYNAKWNNPGRGVAPSLTPRYCSYWKWSLQVPFNYGWLTYLYTHTHTRVIQKSSINFSPDLRVCVCVCVYIYIYIYIYICVCRST